MKFPPLPALSFPLNIPFVLMAGIAVALLVLDRQKRLSQRVLLAAVLGVIAIMFMSGVAGSVGQYLAWRENGIGKFLLPPYQPVAYFLFYVFTQFFFNNCFTLVVAAVLTLFFFLVNASFGGAVFYHEEFFLMFFGFAVVPWPTNGIMAAALLGYVFLGALLHPRERTGVRRLWLPVTLAFLAVSGTLNNALWALRLVR